MLTEFFTILAFGLLFVAVIALASKNGSKSAQLESLKAEIKKQAEEQKRAEKITNSVNNMSNDDVRERLQKLSDK